MNKGTFWAPFSTYMNIPFPIHTPTYSGVREPFFFFRPGSDLSTYRKTPILGKHPFPLYTLQVYIPSRPRLCMQSKHAYFKKNCQGFQCRWFKKKVRPKAGLVVEFESPDELKITLLGPYDLGNKKRVKPLKEGIRIWPYCRFMEGKIFDFLPHINQLIG